jgi:aldose 1-epimerase
MPMSTDSDGGGYRGLLNDPSARTLVAGDLAAVFLPDHGMLCASFRHHGAELLRRVQDLDSSAAKGSTAGIPLLHPWANRLADTRYRAAGREVELDPSSALLHLDEHGLPMHGVPWSRLRWEVTEARRDLMAARLDWTRVDLLALFPFPHRLEMRATIRPDGLTLETTLAAGDDDPVPVCFGFHPYFGLPDLPRAKWRLKLPPMRKLVLDQRGIPTGAEEPFAGFDGRLGEFDFDDGFVLLEERPSFALSGSGRGITVELLAGYRYLQVFAPKDKDLVALEPMTAPANALVSGLGLQLTEASGRFQAAFKISVESL